MLSAVLRNGAQKVRLLAGPPFRCWTSCSASTVRLTCLEDRDGGGKLPASGFKRPELLQKYASSCVARTRLLHSSAVRLKKRPVPEPAPRELDLLRYDMKDLWKGPKPALYLGFAGLIPFVAPPLFMAVTETYFPELAYAQLAYGAAIVSFLGGARWGFALPESSPAKPDWINLTNSVVPSLMAWVTMLISDSILPAGTMIIMALGVSLHYDLSLLPTYPSWFKALRARPDLCGFFSLFSARCFLNGIFPEKKIFSD